jgi:serine protease
VRHSAGRLINTLVLLALLLFATVLLAQACAARVSEGSSEAVEEVLARADFIPNDPGIARQPGGWAALQWNFAGANGVNAPAAWDNLEAAGAPGASGVIVAVVDTGVAYANRSPYRRSPDFGPTQFVPGYDFIGGDRYPHDLHGHGTHVASTIAEQTDNAVGVTGLAYGVQIMPVRVLNRFGVGTVTSVARGIRFAADHGANVINLSLSFAAQTTRRQIAPVLEALDHAHERGSLVVASAGNDARPLVAYPARWQNVLAVGATTEHACKANFSNFGAELDLVAPGGGSDTNVLGDDNCDPRRRGRSIFQITFRPPSVRNFGLRGFTGTSMAAPHVSAAAAAVIASGVLGDDRSPARVVERLLQTARDLGEPGVDGIYGAGLVDAAAATAAEPPPPAAG